MENLEIVIQQHRTLRAIASTRQPVALERNSPAAVGLESHFFSIKADKGNPQSRFYQAIRPPDRQLQSIRFRMFAVSTCPLPGMPATALQPFVSMGLANLTYSRSVVLCPAPWDYSPGLRTPKIFNGVIVQVPLQEL